MNKMRNALSLSVLIGMIGSLGVLTCLPNPLQSSPTYADQLVSDEGLQAIEVIHKQNIGQLHGLHHDMRATLKRLAQDQSDLEATRQLAAQLRAVSQGLDTVAATEQDHPQWASSWSQRHAQLALLTQEMEALLLTVPTSRDGNRLVDQLGKGLQEMKEILDIW